MYTELYSIKKGYSSNILLEINIPKKYKIIAVKSKRNYKNLYALKYAVVLRDIKKNIFYKQRVGAV